MPYPIQRRGGRYVDHSRHLSAANGSDWPHDIDDCTWHDRCQFHNYRDEND